MKCKSIFEYACDVLFSLRPKTNGLFEYSCWMHWIHTIAVWCMIRLYHIAYIESISNKEKECMCCYLLWGLLCNVYVKIHFKCPHRLASGKLFWNFLFIWNLFLFGIFFPLDFLFYISFYSAFFSSYNRNSQCSFQEFNVMRHKKNSKRNEMLAHFSISSTALRMVVLLLLMRKKTLANRMQFVTYIRYEFKFPKILTNNNIKTATNARLLPSQNPVKMRKETKLFIL